MINLSDYVNEASPVIKSISLKKEKGPFLKLQIQSTILKVGRKKVVQQPSGEFSLVVDEYGLLLPPPIVNETICGRRHQSLVYSLICTV